jgi:hypothetical protein
MSIVIPLFLRNDAEEAARQLERVSLEHWHREEDVVDDISIMIVFFKNY